MKIFVYGKTKERAYYKLQNLLNDMRYGDVKNVRKSINGEFIVETQNGDIFQAVVADADIRAKRWEYAYVDVDIDIELVQSIIFPNYIGLNTTGHYEFYA